MSRLWWRTQNLGEREDGTKGPLWQEGRGWLEWGRLNLRIEWKIPCKLDPSLGVDVGGEDGVGGHLGLGPAWLWLHVYADPAWYDDDPDFRPMPRRGVAGRLAWRLTDWLRRVQRQPEREWSVRVGDGSIWWSLGIRKWEDHPIVWHVIDRLFGKRRYAAFPQETETRTVRLPEGPVKLTIEMFLSEWWRDRWPFPTRLMRARVTAERPTPIPGKGENAWDCDDDAIFSLTTPAEYPRQAAEKYVESVMRTRNRYGGKNWRPDGEAAD